MGIGGRLQRSGLRDLSGLSLAVIHMSDRWGRFRGLESNITLAGLFWARHRPAASPLPFVPPLAPSLYDGRRSSSPRLSGPRSSMMMFYYPKPQGSMVKNPFNYVLGSCGLGNKRYPNMTQIGHLDGFRQRYDIGIGGGRVSISHHSKIISGDEDCR